MFLDFNRTVFAIGNWLYLLGVVEAFWSKTEVRRDFRNSKSGNKPSSGEIGINIRTLASPKVGQDQVSGGVSVLCWHAASVANDLLKPYAIR